MTREVIYIDENHISRNRINKLREETNFNRICIHDNIQDNLHCMIISHKGGDNSSNNSGLRIHAHPNKDMICIILEGRMKIQFYDKNKIEKNYIILESYGSGNDFICRIPKSTFYKMIPITDMICIEFIRGPFDKETHNLWLE